MPSHDYFATCAGAVREWHGGVGYLRKSGSFAPLEDSQPRYIAAGGMRSLAKYLAGTATSLLGRAQGERAERSIAYTGRLLLGRHMRLVSWPGCLGSWMWHVGTATTTITAILRVCGDGMAA